MVELDRVEFRARFGRRRLRLRRDLRFRLLVARRGGNPDAVVNALKTLHIETPSWGYADTGTRFGKFHQPACARTIEEKLEATWWDSLDQMLARWQELIATSKRLLAECPQACETACYVCLKTFRNQYHHDMLNRHTRAAAPGSPHFSSPINRRS